MTTFLPSPETRLVELGIQLGQATRPIANFLPAKLLGMVHCSEDFTAQPAVINGASDLLVQIFGEEAGRHARSAIGVRQLPNNAAVEIEMILEVK